MGNRPTTSSKNKSLKKRSTNNQNTTVTRKTYKMSQTRSTNQIQDHSQATIYLQAREPSLHTLVGTEPKILSFIPCKQTTSVHVSTLGCFFHSAVTREVFYTKGEEPPTSEALKRFKPPQDLQVVQISVQRSVVILFDNKQTAFFSPETATLLFIEHKDIDMVRMGYCNAFLVSADEVYRVPPNSTSGKALQWHQQQKHYNCGKVVKAVGGYDHVILLTSDGHVFVTGYGYHGELAGGIATQTEVLGPVEYFETNKIPIKDIAAGYFHSLFLPKDELDTVYCTGRNAEHQLTGIDTSNKLNVCKITVNNVQKIFANAYTSYFQTTEYPLLECGYRQVNSVNVKQVTPIDVFDQVASGSFSDTHTALLSKTKYILDFDWGVENMKFGIFIVDNKNATYKRLRMHVNSVQFSDVIIIQ